MKLALPLLPTLLVLCLTTVASHAQDIPTFYRSQSISTWAAYVSNNTTHGPSVASTQHNNGAAIGFDYNLYPNFVLQPSISARATDTHGPIENFKSYDVGLKLSTHPLLHHFMPYANFLAGLGTVHYVNCNGGLPGASAGPGLGPGCGLRGDNSPVYSPGAGVDYVLTPSFRAKADLQYELWNFGNNVTVQPINLSLGLVYILPFAPHIHFGQGRQ